MEHKTILLVEDNEDDVFALKRTLRQEKIPNPLLVVNDGQEAMDYLSGVGKFADRDLYPMPGIVFLDLKLPYINGFDVLAWIRNQPELGSLIVVVLTSSDETRDYRRAETLGARSYMVKPPAPQDIRKFLSSIQGWDRPGATAPVLIKLDTPMAFRTP